MYSGALYKTTRADTLSQCCDSCKTDPECNVYDSIPFPTDFLWVPG